MSNECIEKIGCYHVPSFVLQVIVIPPYSQIILLLNLFIIDFSQNLTEFYRKRVKVIQISWNINKRITVSFKYLKLYDFDILDQVFHSRHCAALPIQCQLGW